MKITLVDSDPAVRTRLGPIVSEEGITLACPPDGDETGDSVEDDSDLFLIVLRPGVDRFARLKRLKERVKKPVIVLGDRPNHVDSVVALELGADDYLFKDCDPRELLACIRAVLRTRQPPAAETSSKRLNISGLTIDLGSRETYVDGERVALTNSEFEILRVLMEAVGRPVSRDELRGRLVKTEDGRLDRALDVHISHLRQKLGWHRDCIKTIRGKGYQFLVQDRVEVGASKV